MSSKKTGGRPGRRPHPEPLGTRITYRLPTEYEFLLKRKAAMLNVGVVSVVRDFVERGLDGELARGKAYYGRVIKPRLSVEPGLGSPMTARLTEHYEMLLRRKAAAEGLDLARTIRAFVMAGLEGEAMKRIARRNARGDDAIGAA